MNWSVLKKPPKDGGRKGNDASRKRIALSRWVIAAVVLFGVVLLTTGYLFANKSVLLAIDGQEVKVRTFARTVGGFLQTQELALNEKDEVSPAPDTPVKSGMVVTVNHAVPVNVAVDGQNRSLYTRARRVGDLLDEYGIAVGPVDEVAPGREAPVSAGMAVQVVRVKTEPAFVEAPVPYQITKQYTTVLPNGATRVAREGIAGTERQTWQVTYRDGQETGRELVEREVVAEPVAQVLMVGSGWTISRGGDDIRYAEAKDMVATAYTYTGYNTASGVAPYYGVVAVDSSVIPLGSRLYVDGYGYATALDRGGAIRGNRIDLFFESLDEAIRWGVRRVRVYRLD